MATKQRLKQVISTITKKKIRTLKNKSIPKKQKAILKAEMEDNDFFYE